MKKTLAAVAVLGAFAGSALAADVTLYGLVDYGFAYQHVDGDAPNSDAYDHFSMNSGMNSGSRFGLKGSEDLGNGLTVGFVLENGFSADTGALSTDGKIFDRESQLYIKGGFGTLSFGRVGQLASSNGSFGLLGKTSPFSTGWGDTVGEKFVMATGFGRFDNTITYVTPDFAGFKVHAQYSMQTTGGVGEENKASANRYYGLGATYENGPLYLVAVVDSINYSHTNDFVTGSTNPKDDDQWTFTIGGNYDFDVVKVYATAQYFQNATAIGQKVAMSDGSMFKGGYTFGEADGANGYGIAVGLGVPALGGTFKAHVGYMDAEADNDKLLKDFEVKRWNVAVGYDYSLSKRTSLYSAAAYTRDDIKYADMNPNTIEVMAGLIHKF